MENSITDKSINMKGNNNQTSLNSSSSISLRKTVHKSENEKDHKLDDVNKINSYNNVKDLENNSEINNQKQDSGLESDEKEHSIGSTSSSVVYSYSLNTKTLTPKLSSVRPSTSKENIVPAVPTINTNSSLNQSSLNSPQKTSTPKTESPKTATSISSKIIDAKDLLNTSFFTKSPSSCENNSLMRSESSPSVLKTDPNEKPISNNIISPVKSNSQPPIPSTTFSNFKNKNSLNRIRKKEVIKELMESERLYVSDLQMLIENCFNPLEAVSWLPLNEKCLLIRNIQELFAFQQEFLEDMETSVKELKEKLNKPLPEEELNKIMNECVRNISNCFIRRKKKFKVYSEFCSLHQEAINIFREYERKPEMISFIRDFNGKTHSRLHLQDFLIKPVQRICKYPLLLKELIHYSDKNCEELNGLKEAGINSSSN